MTRNIAALPFNQMRRTDRQVEDEAWIKKMLHESPTCAIATVWEDQPFVSTTLFVYDEQDHAIYTHTASTGRTRANVESNERVCLTVSQMGRLFPAERAFDFGVEYASVVVFGRASVHADLSMARRFFEAFMHKYASHLRPGQDYVPPAEDELLKPVVYRIAIESWSGKRREVEPDFPGAYSYSSL
jgi:hypothetical protein